MKVISFHGVKGCQWASARILEMEEIDDLLASLVVYH